MASPKLLEQKEKRPNFDKQYYTNKALKHFSNKFIGQMEINTFAEIIIGLKGSGKSTFIEKIRNNHPHHWRIGVINLSHITENITFCLLEQFEINDVEQFSNPEEIQQHIIKRFHQAIFLGLKIFIFIDAAENLKPSDIKQLLPFHKIAKLVFFASPEFHRIIPQYQDSGVFYRSNILSLGLFEPEDTEKLIKRRLANIEFKGRFPFSSEEISNISVLSHGNPYLIKTLCNQYLKNKNLSLPSLAKTKKTYNEIEGLIDLTAYTNLNKLNDSVKAHEIAREISDINKSQPTKSIKIAKKNLILVSIALLSIGLVGFFSVEKLQTQSGQVNLNQSSKDSGIIETAPLTELVPTTNQTDELQNPALSLEQTKNKSKIETNTQPHIENYLNSEDPDKVPFAQKQSSHQSSHNNVAIIPNPQTENLSVPQIQDSIEEKRFDAPIIKEQSALSDLGNSNPEIKNLSKQSIPTIDIIETPGPTSSPKIPDDKTLTTAPKLFGYQWIERQPDLNYTIQMLGSTDYQKLLTEIKQYQFTLPVGIVGIERIDKPTWYSAIAGSFKSKKAASAAIKKLPRKLRKYKPWSRYFKTIRKNMIKDGDQKSSQSH